MNSCGPIVLETFKKYRKVFFKTRMYDFTLQTEHSIIESLWDYLMIY